MELWKKAVGGKVDSVEECSRVSADVVALKVRILVTAWEKHTGVAEVFRNVFKYLLKVGECGVPTLDLLSSICDFLIKESKLAEDIVEMVTNHSLYLGTLLGPVSSTKTALLQLLLSLCPLSCTTEQIPLLLSGYTATMHPFRKGFPGLFQHAREGRVGPQPVPAVHV